jgi:methionyl-tRNA formyltransferase
MAFPVRVCAVGLRGAHFLTGLVARGMQIAAIASYRQPNDRSESHRAIAKVAAELRIPITFTKKPCFHVDGLTFVVGWQYLFNECPPNVIVFHDSLLPRYRGFSPTVTALLNGDQVVGVTALQPSSRVDAGPILAQQSAQVVYPIKIAQVLALQAEAMVNLAEKIVHQAQTVGIAGTEQDEAQATYSLWRDETDYLINWADSSEQIKRMIDAVGYPYDGAKTYHGERELVIEDASVVDDLAFERRDPGKVWRLDNGRPVVVCGAGLLRIERFRFCDRRDLPFRLRTRFHT